MSARSVALAKYTDVHAGGRRLDAQTRRRFSMPPEGRIVQTDREPESKLLGRHVVVEHAGEPLTSRIISSTDPAFHVRISHANHHRQLDDPIVDDDLGLFSPIDGPPTCGGPSSCPHRGARAFLPSARRTVMYRGSGVSDTDTRSARVVVADRQCSRCRCRKDPRLACGVMGRSDRARSVPRRPCHLPTTLSCLGRRTSEWT